MKTLIVARHGSYADNRLTWGGREEAKRLSEALAKMLGEAKPLIITSDARRARETAEVIAEKFATEIQTYPELNLDSFGGKEVDNAVALVIEKGAEYDYAIVVTHYACTISIPKGVAKALLGKKIELEGEADKGHAHILDCVTGRLEENVPATI